ncbi:hypothetical protein D3C81_1895540 [compost metagenome]
MHAPLGYHFAIEVGEFLDQPDVLQQGRATGAGGLDVEVVHHRGAGGVGQFLIGHIRPLHGLQKFAADDNSPGTGLATQMPEKA